MLLKENRAKSSSQLKHFKGNRQPTKESTTVEKGKTLTLGSKFAVAEGVGVDVDEGVDE